MARPPNIIRPSPINTSIPEDLRAWLVLHLWSETEQRVPLGAYQRLIEKLLREYKDRVESQRNVDATVT